MYCVYLGKAVQTVNPPSGSVGSSQVAASIITGQTALGATPADTDELLISDAGTLKRVDFSYLKTGITMADQWRLTSDYTYTGSGILDSNLEQVDGTGQGTLGSAMTESSGVFTFPSTGIYLVRFNATASLNGDRRSHYVQIQSTTDNSSYGTRAEAISHIKQAESGTTYIQAVTETLLDVTDTSNHKVKFSVFTSALTRGNTSNNVTFMTFIRLGDT